jgi:hypothetical protein
MGTSLRAIGRNSFQEWGELDCGCQKIEVAFIVDVGLGIRFTTTNFEQKKRHPEVSLCRSVTA